MAARRLVVVLIVMLVLSTVAAVLLPTPRDPIGSGSSTTATTTTRTAADRAAGKRVEASMTALGRERVVRLSIGDALRLRVTSGRPDQVEVRGYGLLDAVDRHAPAHFDLFADRSGSFNVVLVEAHRTVGRLVVRQR